MDIAIHFRLSGIGLTRNGSEMLRVQPWWGYHRPSVILQQEILMMIHPSFRFSLSLVSLAVILATGQPAMAADAPSPAAAPASGLAATPPAAPAPAAEASTIVVKVNDVAISQGTLDQAMRALLAQARMPAPTDPAQRQQIEAMALDSLIAEELLYQAAKATVPTDLAQQVEEKFNATKTRLGSPEAFEQALSQNGMTVEEFKTRLGRDLVIAAYIQREVDAKINVGPEQARQFYDQNPDKFKKPEMVHASHILIGADAKASPEEKQAAKQKAEELLVKIKGGADFAEVAKAESTCPSAKKGGDLGTFGRGQMVKPFEEVAFSLQDGEVSEVVETQFGYHLIKSQGKTAAETIPFEQVQSRITTQLKNQEAKKQLAAKVEALKQAAKIEKAAPAS
jgi:peptidyl-prolyl cis-trans isomerase C